MMRLHRLIAILLLLESRGKVKAKELANALETSVRSIYRDLDLLAEAGIPIMTATGPAGGIRLMEGYTVNLKQLNSDDVIHLYLTGMGIYAGGQSESGLKLTNALLKLEKTLPVAYQADIRKARARFYFDDTPWWTERVTIPCLEALRIAVWRSQKLRIEYRKVDGVCSTRNISPYGLVVKQADWYLVACCEDVGAIRTFKCERIVKAERTDEEFEVPDNFVLEDHWNRLESDFKRSCRETEHFPVILKMDRANQALLKRLDVIESAEQGDHFRVTVNLFSYEAACRAMLEMIAQVEVVEPDMLRQFVRTKVLELLAIYS